MNRKLKKIPWANTILGDDIHKHRTLEKILSEIKDGKWKKNVATIRTMVQNRKDKADIQRYKKNHLPLFYPSVFMEKSKTLDNNSNAYATGIVQFDVDDISSDVADKNINLLKKEVGSLLYVFKSPSGGIKFALLTDFLCSDVTQLRKKFRIAYYKCENYIVDATGLHLDSSLQSISQGCYISYDPNIYFNDNPRIFPVQEDVDAELRKEKERKDNAPTFNQLYSADDNEVLRALSHIPNNLSYDERQPINLAILKHIGSDQGKQILLNHWGKNNKKKLEQQLNGYCKIAVTSTVNVATIFHYAIKNGYKSEGINKKPVSKGSPTYDDPILDKQTATNQISNLIGHFFSTKDDTGILVEAGLGKTTTVIEAPS